MKMSTALADKSLISKLAEMLVEQKYAKDKETAIVMIGHVVQELHKDPKKYFNSYKQSQKLDTKAVHGVSIMNNISSSSVHTAKATSA
ncbi:hypothetical protein [Methylosinus sp. Ce-a6]|uniref:hypothetical protein n=1 Tax=Methylosinus sp. Ce-a6 TaxID=2172005 RepID=UPI001357FC5A|nr:hypothetical protein [Methylosinus sp. Ce-a6]